MGEKAPSCPNCDTVLVLRVEPDEIEGLWYECTICGYRTRADTILAEADRTHHRPPTF